MKTLLALAALLMPVGAVGDRWGRKPVLQAGLALFGLSAALAALAGCDFVKHVVVVDKDIDVYNEEQVMWAMAPRVQADQDIDVIKNAKGNTLDNLEVVEPQDILNMARTSNLSGKGGINSSYESSEQSHRPQNQILTN